ncbi:spidroin-2 [Schistocerca gregaria]|uniref:spidroin-2 n=1 Tax=Schistocerca gregaria TaxID=7010 RepID=UPI00211DFCA6|nr:spidroin-2 [Schistocerca gregaria]
MMRELDTVSPVVWPAWCYSGEGQLETEAADATVPSAGGGGRKAGGRAGGGGGGGGSCTPTGAAMNGAGAGAGSTASDSQPPAAAVKTERLSPPGPSTPGGGGGGGGGPQGAASSNSSTASSNSTSNQHHQSGAPDNTSTSSRSGTPGSSYPGTPPERAASPHPLKTDHLARNYSDFMRSLAAKYNNANPNDYLSSAAAAAAAAAAATGARNGYLDPRFAPFKSGAATPFVGLMAPLTAPASPLPGIKGGVGGGVGVGGGPAPTGSPKDEHGGGGGKKGGAGGGGPPTPAPTPAPATDLLGMFPPMIDMSSTQALLSMVRSANASQLENYLKGASSRRPAECSPLDLSPGAVVPPPAKRRAYHAPSRSIGESLFASKDTHRLRRLGSVSPKPRPPAPPPAASASAAPAAGSRVLPCPSLCGAASAATCGPDAAATATWSVDDVAAFVGSIDLCAEYAQNFRDQRIDGCALPLLTEEHMTGALAMRLGPALKLRAALARRLGQCAACAHCLHCHAPQPAQAQAQASAAAAASAGHSPASRPASTGV